MNSHNGRTTFTYGRFSYKLTEKDALGNVTTFDYDTMGYLTTITNTLAKSRVISYSNAKQKIAEVDELSNRTTFACDTSGRLHTITDAKGNTTVYDYNARGDLTTVAKCRAPSGSGFV